MVTELYLGGGCCKMVAGPKINFGNLFEKVYGGC